MPGNEKTVLATVISINPKGRHGPYAVAIHKQQEGEEAISITFSLDEEVWQEDSLPQDGEMVRLSNLRLMNRGWRAFRAERGIQFPG